MKKVQIENLPNEILMKIFGYVEQKWQLSVTCKTFYYVCCKLEANRFVVKIRGKLIMSDKMFTSLMSTSRQFDELHVAGIINEKIYARVLQVISRQRDTITSLHLATAQLSKSQLLNLLNAAASKNVNQIVMESVAIKSNDKEGNNIVTGIRKLKDLTGEAKSIEIASVRRISLDQHCDRKILSILNDFPCDLLEVLVLRFPTNDMRALQQLLCKQRRLKQLTIYTNFIHSISIAHLHLTHLTIESRTISIDALRSQRSTLINLSIINFPLNDDDAFDELCRCTSLKVLKVFVGNNISCDKIRAVSRLENLEDLTMRSCCAAKFDEGQLAAFCSMKFTALLKLELQLPNLIVSDEFLIGLSESLRQLVDLKVECVSIRQLFVALEHFAGLECLNVIIISRFNDVVECLNGTDWNYDGKVRSLMINFKRMTQVESLSINSRIKKIFKNVKKLEINRKKL